MKKSILLLLLPILFVGCDNKPDIMKSPNEFEIEGLLRAERHTEEIHANALVSGYKNLAVRNFDSATYYSGVMQGIHMMDSVIILEMNKIKNNQ